MHKVHSHACSYVRRNAVLAINAIYRLPKGELLLSDAPDLVEKVLQVGHALSPTLLGMSEGQLPGVCAQLGAAAVRSDQLERAPGKGGRGAVLCGFALWALPWLPFRWPSISAACPCWVCSMPSSFGQIHCCGPYCLLW